jgi:ABC-2 type transport system permease protein
VFSVFSSLAGLELFSNGAGYYVSLLGIESHYQNISKGYVDTRDVVYFLSLIALFLKLTSSKVKNRKP